MEFFSKFKKMISVAVVAALGITTLSACTTITYGGGGGAGSSGDNGSSGGGKVGISMSDKTLQRWATDGANMESKLKAAGYTVDLQYADGKIDNQVNQIDNLISGGCNVIVVAPIDGSALTTVLDKAKDANIPVISYDRLVLNTSSVSYYVTFDNALVGKMQGEYIEEKLDLKNQAGPFNIELFTGPTDDNNVNFFFTQGAMTVLQQYIDSGKLKVLSGQTSKEQCATPAWDMSKAQERMENLISQQSYGPSGTKLDAVLCSNDSVSQGVANALKDAGYTSGNFPVLTGQDADSASVKNIIDGYQAMTVFKDTRKSADAVVDMVKAILSGQTPEVNDTETYNNGTGVIPSYLYPPQNVDKDNYKEVLIDSGYYKESDLK